ncbi:MAG: D-glycerate dehydrogenase [Rhodospirillaceae bacterium]|nr:D-glycerate dehydrogenase [Rhodospirillaceae bacterium]|tara:strand:- start:59711 stop:60700 length:990 start_codon:yes stop_codon:yes gene_type:complete
MLKKNPHVYVTRLLPEIILNRMSELFNLEVNNSDKQLNGDDLKKVFNEFDVVVPTVTDKINTEIIKSSGQNLKLIANFGNGVDHIDIDSANKKGIFVTNTPGVLSEDTADIAMALILAVPRRLFEGEKKIREKNWSGWSPNFMLGRRIYGKKLGIVGMGRIGSAVARRAKSFGLNINYHNRNRVAESIEKELNATYWASLDQMLSSMDIISLNCPHTPATYHLLSPRRLKLIKRDAYIVNTSRGEVLHQDTLIELLQEKKIMGAGLDVFEKEPLIDERLLNLKNVFLLPHMSSATLEGRVEMGERVIINIRTMVDGHRPPDRVISGTTI